MVALLIYKRKELKYHKKPVRLKRSANAHYDVTIRRVTLTRNLIVWVVCDFREKSSSKMSSKKLEIMAPKLTVEDGHGAAPSVCSGGALRSGPCINGLLLSCLPSR